MKAYRLGAMPVVDDDESVEVFGSGFDVVTLTAGLGAAWRRRHVVKSRDLVAASSGTTARGRRRGRRPERQRPREKVAMTFV